VVVVAAAAATTTTTTATAAAAVMALKFHPKHEKRQNGLKTSLKDIPVHKNDTIKDFDGLRVALRQIENYHIPQKST